MTSAKEKILRDLVELTVKGKFPQQNSVRGSVIPNKWRSLKGVGPYQSENWITQSRGTKKAP
jgi:hypothetical protein